jgi:2-phosphosulfolactate phosphatase
MYFNQKEYDIRFEWGLNGVEILAPLSDVIVIIDVLSFTTSVDIVVGNQGLVFPYAGEEDALPAYAQSVEAVIASHRRQDETAYSLAPSSLLNIPEGTRLVLPSPNGSTLSMATGRTPTLAACLRNARAVAEKASQLGKRISVIAAGERWTDGSLRPALEDLLGAGAVIVHLAGQRSPESQLAAAGFLHYEQNLPETLLRCGSGKELTGRGFQRDVEIASSLNVSSTAPLLKDGAYQA